MGWKSAGEFMDDRTEERITAAEVQRQRGLESARRRVEVQYGPPPPDDPLELTVAERLAYHSGAWLFDSPEHLIDVRETHRPGFRTMYRAHCMCGWRARISEPTPRMARKLWERHAG